MKHSHYSSEVYAAREKNGVYIPKERYQQEESERKVYCLLQLKFFILFFGVRNSGSSSSSSSSVWSNGFLFGVIDFLSIFEILHFWDIMKIFRCLLNQYLFFLLGNGRSN